MRKEHTPLPDGLSLEKMIAYLDGALGPEAEREVDDLMEKEPAYVDAMQALESALQKDPSKRNLLLAIDQEMAVAKSHPKVRWHNTWYLAAAAIVAILVGITWWMQAPSPTDLAHKMLSHYPYGIRSASGEAAFDQAIAVYNQGKTNPIRYAEATLLLRKVFESDSSEATAFYLGASLALSGKYAEAIPLFHWLCTAPDSSLEGPMQEDACWYLALAYLLTDNSESARPLLQRLSQASFRDERRQQANKLLQRMS